MGLLKTARDAGYAQACQDVGFEKEAIVMPVLKGLWNVGKGGLRQAGITGTKSWRFARPVNADTGQKAFLPRLQTGGQFKGSWDTMSGGRKAANVGMGAAALTTGGAGVAINKANASSKMPGQLMNDQLIAQGSQMPSYRT